MAEGTGRGDGLQDVWGEAAGPSDHRPLEAGIPGRVEPRDEGSEPGLRTAAQPVWGMSAAAGGAGRGGPPGLVLFWPLGLKGGTGSLRRRWWPSLPRVEPEGHSRAWHLVLGLPVVASGSPGCDVGQRQRSVLQGWALLGRKALTAGRRGLPQEAGHELQEGCGHPASRVGGHPGVPRSRGCPAVSDTLPLTGTPRRPMASGSGTAVRGH